MTQRSSAEDTSPPGVAPVVAWFCLRSQLKHEHIAAGHLRQIEGVEVFSPRIQFQRATRHGPVTVTESLFPNYLFAKFDWKQSLMRVHHAPGVKEIVHFGSKWPTVPEAVIHDLREQVGPDELHRLPVGFKAGEEVTLAGGAFHGLDAVIKQVLPGSRRVMVLLDFLGRQTTVEVEAGVITRHLNKR